MPSRFIYCFVLLFSMSLSFAQSNILNASSPDDIDRINKEQEELDDSKPLPYGYVDKRDIMWSKIVWEKIDLNQKLNYPLLYPLDSNRLGEDRQSLFQVLINCIKKGATEPDAEDAITEVYSTSYFQQKKDYDEIQNSLKAIFLPDVALDLLGQYGITGTENVQLFLNRALADELGNYPDLYSEDLINQMKPYVIPTEITGADITAYLIKGIWYFDKRQGALKYRLIGIAPAGYDIQTQNPTYSGDPKVIPYFWVWYKDARNALHQAKVLNSENGAKPLTFDHLLNSRRFDAVIYKTQNIYEDREIENYIQDNALMQLLEARRIKDEIRNFELDLWAY
ncbi:type IX secretion system ring subunit PorN/GldN [Mesohalobacter halotolerans]|uniref:Gliding motility protein GldN n=1 Tax=Mesohalobacter halotolerans TaxID=1883405 RepID=A0A4U5TQM2_9FLAO|nr:gliding motility protein GldN [Mesohalobacter halotolerans]TKS56031.1 gliding motility protein GldN [Mesohalobacter halotolerans]